MLNKILNKVNKMTTVVNGLQDELAELRTNQRSSFVQTPGELKKSIDGKSMPMSEEEKLDFDWQNTPLSKTNQDLLQDDEYFLTIFRKYDCLMEFR